MADYLGCSVGYLMGKENDIVKSYPNISEEDINMLNSLELQDRETVRALMKSLLSK